MCISRIFENKKKVIVFFVSFLLLTALLLPYDVVHNKVVMLKLKKVVNEANAGGMCPINMGGNVSMVQPCTVTNQAGTCNCCTEMVGNYVCGAYDFATYAPAGGSGTGMLCFLKGLVGIDGSPISMGDGILGCHVSQINVFRNPMAFATSGLAKNNNDDDMDTRSGIFNNSLLVVLVKKVFSIG